MNRKSTARRILTVFLFLSIAVTAWLMMHQALQTVPASTHHDIVFNPGYQHCQRLKVATARAAVDVLGMTGAPAAETDSATPGYSADYRLQRMQMQADAEGLDRWAAGDTFRQGLLLEIRTSLANFRIALDQTSGEATPPAGRAPNSFAGRIEPRAKRFEQLFRQPYRTSKPADAPPSLCRSGVALVAADSAPGGSGGAGMAGFLRPLDHLEAVVFLRNRRGSCAPAIFPGQQRGLGLGT